MPTDETNSLISRLWYRLPSTTNYLTTRLSLSHTICTTTVSLPPFNHIQLCWHSWICNLRELGSSRQTTRRRKYQLSGPVSLNAYGTLSSLVVSSAISSTQWQTFLTLPIGTVCNSISCRSYTLPYPSTLSTCPYRYPMPHIAYHLCISF